MRVLIIGAGAIGIALGTFLKSRNIEVDFIARGATYDAIKQEGIARTGLFGEYSCKAGEVGVYQAYEELQPDRYEYVIITTKTMANASVSEALWNARACIKPDGKLIIMQNGWGNDVPYLKYFSKEQVYNARVITGFQRSKPNISEITVHTAPILLGSLQGCESTCMEPLAQALNQAGMPTQVTEELEKYLWAKMLYNTTLNPLGAILRVNYGALMESEASRAIMNQLIEETYAVMGAAGYTTNWEDAEAYKKVFYEKLIPDTYHHRASTLQDIEKKQKTEIDTLNGCIVELAEKYGVSVPGHQMIVRLIHSIEDDFACFL